MAAFALLRLCDGSGVPAYYDAVGHAVHPRLRPRYFAWQQAASALGTLLSATAARWLLAALPFPWNFAASFSTALVLGIAARGPLPLRARTRASHIRGGRRRSRIAHFAYGDLVIRVFAVGSALVASNCCDFA